MAGQLRAGTEPRRTAALTMETVMFTAQANSAPTPDTGDNPDGMAPALRPVSASEIWDFIAHGITKAD